MSVRRIADRSNGGLLFDRHADAAGAVAFTPQATAMPSTAPAILREPTVTLLARPQFSAPAHLPVQSAGESTDGERLVEFAGRLRTMSQRNPAGRPTREYLALIKRQEQGSALEHATYTLLLEGVSRSVAHELRGHRAGFAFTELSQRYVDDTDACFVMPPAIIGEASLEAAWLTQITGAHESYLALVNAMMTRYGWVDDKVHRRKMAREAAAGVLPNSAETKLVVTGNARDWRTMLEAKAIESAELELRRLALVVLQVMQGEAPAFFSDFEIYDASDRHPAARVTVNRKFSDKSWRGASDT